MTAAVKKVLLIFEKRDWETFLDQVLTVRSRTAVTLNDLLCAVAEKKGGDQCFEYAQPSHKRASSHRRAARIGTPNPF